MKKSLFIIALAFAVNAIAEETETLATSEATTTATTQADAQAVGRLDLRPSYTGKGADGSWDYHTENFAELGYQFDSNSILSYRQEFNTNLYNSRPSANGGMDLTAQAGFFRGQLKNLLKQDEISLGYEARAYIPTNAAKRDAGQITSVRNYLNLGVDLGEGHSVMLSEIPIVHLYDRSGSNNAANPAFENRVQLDGLATLTEGLTFELPVIYSNTRYRSFQDGASNNDAWENRLWIAPELVYALDAKYSVGLGYYSENLLTGVSEGFETGTYQLIFAATL